MRYSDNNLIKYEDTIRMHFDTTGRFAWLTLKNYGFVFCTEPPDAVTVVTVGVPATESGALPESLRQTDGLTEGEFKPYPQTISIGARLDAINVIKLQVAILTITSKKRITNVFTRSAIIRVIDEALQTLLKRSYPINYWGEDDKNFFRNTDDNVGRMLNKPPGAPAVWQAIKAYRPDNVGFSAYFPEPSLILQEERTCKKRLIVDPPLGKTFNTDTRDIAPILADMRTAPKWEFHRAIRKVDTRIKANTGTKEETTGSKEETTGSKEETTGAKEETTGTLHIEIDRINCFGFRGDSRDLQQIKDGNGLLAGVTRTDPGVDKYKDRALVLDTLLLEGSAREYLDGILDLDIMHLGKFTAEKDFKGYVSATKSTAIAKCFANYYEKVETDLTTYCYAVRCRGGFHLPSHVPTGVKKNWDTYLKLIHQFVTYAEQEVTVPGAIWWPDIVGMRVIQCNKDCQFFSGPVFLQDYLMGEDNDAFSALFELLSGKSQGKSSKNSQGFDIIEKSYKNPPFACLTAGLATMGSNSVSSVSTSSAAVAHLSATKLSFGRQLLGTSSAFQNVKLTNLGGEPLLIRSTKLLDNAHGNFSYIKPARHRVGVGDSQTISVSFGPKPPFVLNKRSPGRSQNDPLDLDERTATLEIRTSTSKSPTEHDASVSLHTVSLTGTVAPAVEPWSVSPKSLTLTFEEQGMNTISAPKVLTVVNNEKRPFLPEGKIDEGLFIKVVVAGDFKVAGDHERCDKDGERVPNATYTIMVTFEPKQTGERKGTITITHSGLGSPHVVSLFGTGGEQRKHLEISDDILDFGNQGMGTSSDPRYGTLTNNGNAPLTVSNIEVIPDSEDGDGERDFSWETTNREQTVYAGQSRRISVTFTPSRAGNRKAALKITSDALDSPHKVSLKGFGVAATLAPNSLTFASRKLRNRSAEKDVTFTNPGPARLTITEIKFSGDNDFHRTAPEEELTLPCSLEAGQSCKISVAFEPIAAGKRTGTLSVTYKYRAPRLLNLKVSLTGTGTDENV